MYLLDNHLKNQKNYITDKKTQLVLVNTELVL